MKKFSAHLFFSGSLLIFFLLSIAQAEAAEFYVAPDGSDNNAGTISSPFRSLDKLSSMMVAGDHAYVRGGTYQVPGTPVDNDIIRISNLTGTPSKMIVIENYPGEKPIFDFSGNTYPEGGTMFGLSFRNNQYVHLKGLRFTGLAQMPGRSVAVGIIISNATNNKLEQLEVDHIGGYGFMFGSGANNNLILNSDAHHLDDRYTGWDNANGFNITGGVDATGNIFEGDRAWCISDDGWDLFDTDGFVTIKNSWSFWNGYECTSQGTRIPRGDGQGFKLGPTTHYTGRTNTDYSNTLLRVMTNNIAFENLRVGFDQNQARAVFQLYNNTTYGNGNIGYRFGNYPTIQQQFKNNISFGDYKAYSGTEITGVNNSWNTTTPITEADFQSILSIGADGPRKEDGSLPDIPFLKLSSKSKFIDAGTNVGLPFNGLGPDMGAFEYTTPQITISSPIVTFDSVPVFDTIAPASPTKLFATTTSPTQVLLSWVPSTDNVGVVNYRVKRGDALVVYVADAFYLEAGLSPETTYTYTIEAIDSSTNISPPSTISVTTPPMVLQTESRTAVNNLSTAQPTPPPPVFSPLTGPFSIGQRSDEVKKLQTMLIADGSMEGVVTGYYGPQTQKAVETFQTKYGLITQGTPSTTGFGLAGPATRAHLNSLYAGSGGGLSSDREALIASLKKKVAELTAILQTLIAKLAALKAARGM